MRSLFLIVLAVCALAFYEANASCNHDGKTYNKGDRFYDQCNKCRCGKDGKVKCSDNICECKWRDCKNLKCPDVSRCTLGSHTPSGRCCPICNMTTPMVPESIMSLKTKVCSPVTCRMYCQFGYIKDDHGCDMCKCKGNPCDEYKCTDDKPNCVVKNNKAECQKCSPVMCKMYCEFGFKIENGCEICECNVHPCKVDPKPCPKDSESPVCVLQDNKAVCHKCPGICHTYCKYGLKFDADRCPMCECRDDPCGQSNICPQEKPYCVVENYQAVCQKCDPTVCMMNCRYGFKKDREGCDICECKNGPCTPNPCPADEHYCMVKNNEAVCQNCRPLLCLFNCQYGFKENEEGCYVCECKDHPCMGKICPAYHICEPRNEGKCIPGRLCPSTATCVFHPSLPCSDPAKDTFGNITICSKDYDSSECPTGYSCQKSVSGFPPVCCPSTRCQYGGEIYKNGDTFPSLDGCNTCFCKSNGDIGCTQMECPKKGCTHNEKNQAHGEKFPRGDGCNTCTCANGAVSCTKAYCAHCERDDIVYEVDEYVENGSCVLCQCVNDHSEPSGARIACAVDDCPSNR